MNDEQKHTLEAVARFGPIKQRELKLLVPEVKPYVVETALEKLNARGFISVQGDEKHYNQTYDDDVICINTDPFNLPTDDQQALGDAQPDRASVITENLPDEIETSETITLELSAEQTKLFEKMRADVSRTCGTMDEEEFLDWVLREARRMTEV